MLAHAVLLRLYHFPCVYGGNNGRQHDDESQTTQQFVAVDRLKWSKRSETITFDECQPDVHLCLLPTIRFSLFTMISWKDLIAIVLTAEMQLHMCSACVSVCRCLCWCVRARAISCDLSRNRICYAAVPGLLETIENRHCQRFGLHLCMCCGYGCCCCYCHVASVVLVTCTAVIFHCNGTQLIDQFTSSRRCSRCNL